MPAYKPTRRTFCTTAALSLLGPHLLHSQIPSSRPDVAAIDHDRILTAADRALTAAPTPITTLKSPASPHDFYAEPKGFSTHREALLTLSRQVSALAAALHITRKEQYAAQAVLLLQAWFITPATSMNPDLTQAGTIPGDPKPHFEGIVDAVPLAEIAQAIPFLARSQALRPDDLASLKTWFASYLTWLTDSRLAGLARDQKDHHGTAWLFQASAIARFIQNEPVLSDLRHRFKTVTLRAQTVADGTFPHELSTPYPYRNSLFNLDLLTASCLLLSSQFESLWEFELQDGPGLRAVVARHAPYIRDRGAWPYRADLDHFTSLPFRCSSLLFAARAYNRPEYADLWKSLPPDIAVQSMQNYIPISQPILWTSKSI